MTHSINYYIQLSDEISTIIDGMNKEELTELAFDVLRLNRTVLMYKKAGVELNREAQPVHCSMVTKDTLHSDDCIALARGLLAKAI